MNNVFAIPGILGPIFPKLMSSVEATMNEVYPFNTNGIHYLPFDCYPDLELSSPSILHQCSKRIINIYSILNGMPKVTYSTFNLCLFDTNQKRWLKLSMKGCSRLQNKWSPKVTFSGILMLRNSTVGIIKKYETVEDFLINGPPNFALVSSGELERTFDTKILQDSSIQGNLFFYFQGLYVPRNNFHN
jgi:hypothetical protein